MNVITYTEVPQNNISPNLPPDILLLALQGTQNYPHNTHSYCQNHNKFLWSLREFVLVFLLGRLYSYVTNFPSNNLPFPPTPNPNVPNKSSAVYAIGCPIVEVCEQRVSPADVMVL